MSMNAKTGIVLNLLTATVLCFCITEALATPKAAEHEDAPVTLGTDVARPRPFAKQAKQHVAGKTRTTAKGKPVKRTRPQKTVKAGLGKT
jgi:hypothetical protein